MYSDEYTQMRGRQRQLEEQGVRVSVSSEMTNGERLHLMEVTREQTKTGVAASGGPKDQLKL